MRKLIDNTAIAPSFLLAFASTMLMLTLLPMATAAQQTSSTPAAFHTAANHYIAGNQQQALQALEQGLRSNPTDPKLNALYQKIKQQQEQQKKENQSENPNKNQSSPQKQQGAGGDKTEEDMLEQGQKKEQPNGQQQEQRQQQQRQSEEGEGEQQELQARDPEGEVEKRLREMNISPEKARMILEAMRSNEIQYLQQKQRRPERRQRSNKPDW